MRESRVITHVWFEPSQGFDVRGSLTFSDATLVRLDPDLFKLSLKLDADDRYPTDADLSVRTRTFEPNALRALLLVEVLATLPTDEDGNSPTSVGLRLYDGTSELFWNGAAWAIAGAGDWNTEAEVNANLASYDASARKFALVFNLVTTDDRYTPLVEGARVLWRGPVDWVDDVLVDSLVGSLQDELTYLEDAAFPPLPAASASIDLDDYTDDQARTIVDVDAVFDHANDPTHATDLLSAYDPGTRVVTLSSPIPLNGVPFLRTEVRPVVAWDTNQDFAELGAVPQVILRDASSTRSARYPGSASSSIVNRVTGAGVKVPAPYRATYEIVVEVVIDRTRTQARLLQELMRYFTEGPSSEVGPFLRSVGTDRRYRIWLIDEFRSIDPRLNLADVRTFEATIRIRDVALDLYPAEDVYAVQQMKLGFAHTPADVEAEAAAADAPVPTAPAEEIVAS